MNMKDYLEFCQDTPQDDDIGGEDYIDRMKKAGLELAEEDCADLRKLLDKWSDEHIGGVCDSKYAEEAYRNVIEEELNATLDMWWNERITPYITKPYGVVNDKG